MKVPHSQPFPDEVATPRNITDIDDFMMVTVYVGDKNQFVGDFFRYVCGFFNAINRSPKLLVAVEKRYNFFHRSRDSSPELIPKVISESERHFFILDMSFRQLLSYGTFASLPHSLKLLNFLQWHDLFSLKYIFRVMCA